MAHRSTTRVPSAAEPPTEQPPWRGGWAAARDRRRGRGALRGGGGRGAISSAIGPPDLGPVLSPADGAADGAHVRAHRRQPAGAQGPSSPAAARRGERHGPDRHAGARRVPDLARPGPRHPSLPRRRRPSFGRPSPAGRHRPRRPASCCSASGSCSPGWLAPEHRRLHLSALVVAAMLPLVAIVGHLFGVSRAVCLRDRRGHLAGRGRCFSSCSRPACAPPPTSRRSSS